MRGRLLVFHTIQLFLESILLPWHFSLPHCKNSNDEYTAVP